MKDTQQTARVGLFFLLGLALVWVTFQTLSDGKVFRDKGYNLIAGFESLKELREGDEVRMAGVKIGSVEKTRLAGRRAEAVLHIDPKVAIKEDATATIVMAGLIGTNYVSIDLGTSAAGTLRSGAEIRTNVSPDINTIMSDLGNLGKKLENALGTIDTALNGTDKEPGLMKNLNRLVTDNHDNVTAGIASFKDVAAKLNRGEGTLGKLLNDSKLHDDLVATINEIKGTATEAKTFVANAQTIVDQVKAGKGTLGALVYDDATGNDLKASVKNIREMSDKIARGEGTLGKLINDDSTLRDAQAIMKKADRALDGLGDSGPITAVGVVANGLF